jgi:sirohydrochlorin cobaltochelatase
MCPNEKTPIVMAAFGSTSRAMHTYTSMDAAVKHAFPGHPIIWAYTSRLVCSHMRHQQNVHLKSPLEALHHLALEGHTWAVVQSVHLICGHEFYRLVEDVKQFEVRTSIGLPILCSPLDYEETANALLADIPIDEGRATVLIGHGTDHPAWSAYPTFARILEKKRPQVYMATLENDAGKRELVATLVRAGIRCVTLVPLMLVAGVHVSEDIAGPQGSWKSEFEAAGLPVTVKMQGLGQNRSIVALIIRHVRQAREMIV